MVVFKVTCWTNIFNFVHPNESYLGEDSTELGLYATEELAKASIDEMVKRDIAKALDNDDQAWIGAREPEEVNADELLYEFEIKSVLIYENATGDCTRHVYYIRPQLVHGAA